MKARNFNYNLDAYIISFMRAPKYINWLLQETIKDAFENGETKILLGRHGKKKTVEGCRSIY